MKDEFNDSSWSHFWLLLWFLAILDDADRREKEKHKKQQREKQLAEELRAKPRRDRAFRP